MVIKLMILFRKKHAITLNESCKSIEKQKAYMSVTWIAWFMAAVCNKIVLTRRKVDEFNLQLIPSKISKK